MYTITSLGLVRFSRPYPFDLERKQKIEQVMFSHGIKSVTELALKLNMDQGCVSKIINGKRLSRRSEEKIAAFFGMEREALFIIRSASELMAMFDAEEAARKKQGAA